LVGEKGRRSLPKEKKIIFGQPNEVEKNGEEVRGNRIDTVSDRKNEEVEASEKCQKGKCSRVVQKVDPRPFLGS